MRAGIVRLGKKRPGDFGKVFKRLKGAIETAEPDFSLMVPSERIKVSVCKLKYRKSLHVSNGLSVPLHVVVMAFSETV